MLASRPGIHGDHLRRAQCRCTAAQDPAARGPAGPNPDRSGLASHSRGGRLAPPSTGPSCGCTWSVPASGQVNDVWIAAIALANELPIVTQDQDFDALADFPGITLIHVLADAAPRAARSSGDRCRPTPRSPPVFTRWGSDEAFLRIWAGLLEVEPHETPFQARTGAILAGTAASFRVLSRGVAVAANGGDLSLPGAQPAMMGTRPVRSQAIDGARARTSPADRRRHGDREITAARKYVHGAAGEFPGIDTLPLDRSLHHLLPSPS